MEYTRTMVRPVLLFSLLTALLLSGCGSAAPPSTGATTPPESNAGQAEATQPCQEQPDASDPTAAPKRSRAASKPKPAAAPKAAVKIGQYKLVKDEAGARIIGFVQNTGGVPVVDLQVVGSVVNSSGKPVSTGNSIYTRSPLPQKERTPFLVLLDPPNVGKATKVELQTEFQPYDPDALFAAPRATGLVVQGDISKRPTDRYSPYVVTGRVRNTGKQAAELVEVVGIAYDKAGKPVDVAGTFTRLERIPARGASPFSLDFFTRGARSIDRYDVFVQGQPAE